MHHCDHQALPVTRDLLNSDVLLCVEPLIDKWNVVQAQRNREAEEKKKPIKEDPFAKGYKVPIYDKFPEITDGERIFQKNSGDWDFTLDESDDGDALVLDVDVGKYLDTSLIQVRAALEAAGCMMNCQSPSNTYVTRTCLYYGCYQGTHNDRESMIKALGTSYLPLNAQCSGRSAGGRPAHVRAPADQGQAAAAVPARGGVAGCRQSTALQDNGPPRAHHAQAQPRRKGNGRISGVH